MQGFIAYFYDHIRPNTSVELNQCRFNHMGMDVRYRNQPNFRRNIPGVGGCRNGAKACEDCMTTPMEVRTIVLTLIESNQCFTSLALQKKIYSVHYTFCRKPWQCMAIGNSGGRAPGGGRATAINTDSVDLDHCLELVRHWHDLRMDFENQLYELTKDETIKSAVNGTYKPDIFRGHCDGDGNDHYKVISGTKETFQRVQELYLPSPSAVQELK